MARSYPIIPTKESAERLVTYYRTIAEDQNTLRSSMRTRFEKIDKQYSREVIYTQEKQRAEAANNSGDPSRLQDIVIPVVMPQVEAAVTYQSSVYVTGDPLFGVVASPEYMDEALQLETTLEAQALRGGWPMDLIQFFRNGFKYNFSPIEVCWVKETVNTVTTDVNVSTKQGTPTEVIWEGNDLKVLDPYNTFVDTRVPASEVYKDGDYAGYTELYTRTRLKRLIAELNPGAFNVREAYESSSSLCAASNREAANYFIPSINPLINAEEYADINGTNWMRWAGLAEKGKIDYKDMYEVTKLHCRIIPSDFGIVAPKANTPQIYTLYIVNHSVLIYAQVATNAHNYLPILVGQPQEDNLSYQAKSLAENGIPFQQLSTAYMSSIIASRRRSITDRVLYDAKRISSADINSPNPSAKIPVRPSANNKPISDAVYAFPYREDQAAISVQQINLILSLANELAGQNRASQGQFQKGNRTLQEYSDVMANANGRDQLVAILLQFQVFMPMKHILKTNILQYQGAATLYNENQQQAVNIDPVKLRNAVLNFRVSDGLIPSSKIIGAEAFSTAVQVIGSSPTLAGNYNLGPAFSYLMKTQGADLRSFEKSPEQVAYEQAVTRWEQIAMAAIDKGMSEKQLPPMPLPEQFNYNVNQQQQQKEE